MGFGYYFKDQGTVLGTYDGDDGDESIFVDDNSKQVEGGMHRPPTFASFLHAESSQRKKVAFSIVKRHILNTWEKYGVERVMGIRKCPERVITDLRNLRKQGGTSNDGFQTIQRKVAHDSLVRKHGTGSKHSLPKQQVRKLVYQKRTTNIPVSNVFSVLEEDNGKPMNDLVDDVRKKVMAPPRKTGIWLSKKTESLLESGFTTPNPFDFLTKEDGKSILCDLRREMIMLMWRMVMIKWLLLLLLSLCVTLQRIQKFFVAQDIGARVAVHIFNRISFAIAKEVRVQIVSRLPSNLLVREMMWVDREVMLPEVRIHCPAISRWVEFCHSNPARLFYGQHTLYSHQGVQLFFHAWYLDNGTIIGDSLVVGKVLELILEDGPRIGLRVNVDKTKKFWPKKDARSRLAGVFPPSTARPLHGFKLLCGPASLDFDFISQLVMKWVSISPKICFKFGISGLLHQVATTIADRIRDKDTSQSKQNLQSSSMTFIHKTLIIPSVLDSCFNSFTVCEVKRNALSAFNAKMKIGLLSNPSKAVAPKLMKKLANIYFTHISQTSQSTFSLSTRKIALWKSQMEDHTSNWLRVVTISGLGQTINGSLRGIFMETLPISADKEVDIGLGGGRDKPLRPADMLLYSWDIGLDVFVDLTGSSSWDG
ncbi:hypothetical protein Tco_0923667 [Tanacetum coccineum]|uniref:Uncharacterized protein n=1 Tax=Tanacetum coccineum TaxID=301880 RepID=A0ABQ5D2Q1_9ASTR